MKQEIILKPITDIIPYVNNPKQHPAEQVDKIASSIKNYGFTVPIVLDGQNEIIMGHGRLQAAKKLGMEEVPCIVRDDLTEAQVKALRIADNKVAESEWDVEILLAEIEGIDDFTGFTLEEIGAMELDLRGENEVVDDEVPELPEEPKSKLGDLYILGRHRLLCGDSTKAEDVERLMDGNVGNLIVTDPPYNVDYEGSNSLKIQNDNMEDSLFYDFLYSAYKNMLTTVDAGSGIYVFHADLQGHNFRKAMIDSGWKFAQCCVWVKNSLVMGRSDYHWKHEPILYGWKPGDAHRWYGDRSQSTVWDFNKPNKNDKHPTMKPVELCAYPIKNSTQANAIVVDLFGGSGSTLMASEQLNRICYMMELDPKYCDVIVERWENFTGQKAELVGE